MANEHGSQAGANALRRQLVDFGSNFSLYLLGNSVSIK
jgi:hypothetical protein